MAIVSMKKVAELESELQALAIKLARERGLATNGEEVTLTLRIKGHRKAQDGWSTDISDYDWEKILACKWGENQRSLFEALRARNNEPLTGDEVKGFNVSDFPHWPISFVKINHGFKGKYLPFSFSPVQVLPVKRQRKEGRYRLFKRPTA